MFIDFKNSSKNPIPKGQPLILVYRARESANSENSFYTHVCTAP